MHKGTLEQMEVLPDGPWAGDWGWREDIVDEYICHLRKQRDQLRKLLEDVEWADVGGADYNIIQCPSCRQSYEYTFEPEGGRKHKPACALAAALGR